MPRKLVRCVAKLKRRGYPASRAWPICIKSTGLKPHKKKRKLVSVKRKK